MAACVSTVSDAAAVGLIEAGVSQVSPRCLPGVSQVPPLWSHPAEESGAVAGRPVTQVSVCFTCKHTPGGLQACRLVFLPSEEFNDSSLSLCNTLKLQVMRSGDVRWRSGDVIVTSQCLQAAVCLLVSSLKVQYLSN